MKVHRTLGRRCNPALMLSFVVCCIWALHGSPAQAQTRVNDRDMAAMMRNLHQDAHSFRPRFDDAVHKSTIRHTSQERDSRDMSRAFDRETEKLLHHFKKDRNGEAEFRAVSDTAAQIDHVVGTVDLGPEVRSQWQKIRTELHQVAVAYGFPDRFGDRNSGMNPM